MIFTKITGPLVGIVVAVASVDFVEKALPVVWFMKADQISFVDGAVSAHVVGRKIRDCIFVKNAEVGWYLKNGVWYEIDAFEFVDDPVPGNTRDKSVALQDFGIWRWSDIPEGAEKVKMTALHRCSGNLELTSVGPFTITAKGEDE